MVVVLELVVFPVHTTNWSCRVSDQLQQLIGGNDATGRIHFWRQRWQLFDSSTSQSVFARDGVHLRRRGMIIYWRNIRYAVITLTAVRRSCEDLDADCRMDETVLES